MNEPTGDNRNRKSPSARRKLAYPMPCPNCRRMISAQDPLCPYCGANTDAVLWPARAVLPLVVVAVVLGCGFLAGFLIRRELFFLALLLGLALALKSRRGA